MAEKHSGIGKVAGTVWEIAEPIAESLGLTLWDIRFLKEGAEHYLRVFIEKEGGVSIDDCVAMSHALDKPLDDADPISCSYCLEVSSPGAERSLTREEHFKQYIGKKIKIKLIRPVDGVREFDGTLDAFESGAVTITSPEGKTYVIAVKDTSYIKADDFEF